MMLVLPHFRNIGGAGKYITDFIEGLKTKNVILKVGGAHQNDYLDFGGYNKTLVNALSLILLPNYKGVSKAAKFFYSMKTVIFLPYIFILSLVEKKENIEFVVLTSSIQILYIPFIKIVYPKTKVVIIIQENLDINNLLLGKIVLFMLKKYDFVVGIDRDWCSKVGSRGVETIYLPNNFNIPEIDTLYTPEFDAVYVGGGQSIKGFEFLMCFFEKFSEKKRINIQLLGSFSNVDVNRIDRLNNKNLIGSKLHIVGQVPNCNPFIMNSKFLILPIISAHFCRPAIEAGLLRKTFLITELHGLSDFSKFDYNCKSFKANNLNDFSQKFFEMIDQNDLSGFENNNYEMSLNFALSSSMDLFFNKLGI